MDKETGWILGAGLVGAAGLFVVWMLRQKSAPPAPPANPAQAGGGSGVTDLLDAANTAGCMYITGGKGGQACAAVGKLSTAATVGLVKQTPNAVIQAGKTGFDLVSTPFRVIGGLFD